MTLTEFLLARIAEDEGTALYAQTHDNVQPEDWGGWWFGHQQHYARHDPARVLAECEAKRRIVTESSILCASDRASSGGRLLAALAVAYADHPDYDEAWRP